MTKSSASYTRSYLHVPKLNPDLRTHLHLKVRAGVNVDMRVVSWMAVSHVRLFICLNTDAWVICVPTQIQMCAGCMQKHMRMQVYYLGACFFLSSPSPVPPAAVAAAVLLLRQWRELRNPGPNRLHPPFILCFLSPFSFSLFTATSSNLNLSYFFAVSFLFSFFCFSFSF